MKIPFYFLEIWNIKYLKNYKKWTYVIRLLVDLSSTEHKRPRYTTKKGSLATKNNYYFAVSKSFWDTWAKHFCEFKYLKPPHRSPLQPYQVWSNKSNGVEMYKDQTNKQTNKK
jgi:hypothetical protein